MAGQCFIVIFYLLIFDITWSFYQCSSLYDILDWSISHDIKNFMDIFRMASLAMISVITSKLAAFTFIKICYMKVNICVIKRLRLEGEEFDNILMDTHSQGFCVNCSKPWWGVCQVICLINFVFKYLSGIGILIRTIHTNHNIKHHFVSQWSSSKCIIWSTSFMEY